MEIRSKVQRGPEREREVQRDSIGPERPIQESTLKYIRHPAAECGKDSENRFLLSGPS